MNNGGQVSTTIEFLGSCLIAGEADDPPFGEQFGVMGLC
jgi:hypothetical protein